MVKPRLMSKRWRNIQSLRMLSAAPGCNSQQRWFCFAVDLCGGKNNLLQSWFAWSHFILHSPGNCRLKTEKPILARLTEAEDEAVQKQTVLSANSALIPKADQINNQVAHTPKLDGCDNLSAPANGRPIFCAAKISWLTTNIDSLVSLGGVQPT